MIFFILLFGLILRLISLNQSLWLDEATSALVVRNFNFGEIITKFSPGDFHPPLYYLVIKGWSLLFGVGEIALRTPSVIFGILTIWVVYKIALLITNHKSPIIARLSALLLATSGLHIYYSQEARMYSLTAFFASLLIFSFVKTVKRGRLGDWIVFSLSIFFLVFTDYVALFLIPVLWLYVWLTKQNNLYWKKFLASHIILVTFIIFWFPFFVEQIAGGMNVYATSPSWWKILGSTSVKNILLVPVKFMLGRIGFDNKWLYGMVVVMATWLYGYLIFRSIKLIKNLRVVWLWLVLPILLGIIISIRLPVLSYFRFLFCLPAFYLLVAVGIKSLSKNRQKIAFFLVLFLNLTSSILYLTGVRFHREDWRNLVSFVESQKTKDSITLFVVDANMEAYRYYDSGANVAGPNGLTTKYGEIWLMRYLQPVFDPSDSLRAKIEASGYNKEKEYDFNGVVVWKYVR